MTTSRVTDDRVSVHDGQYYDPWGTPYVFVLTVLRQSSGNPYTADTGAGAGTLQSGSDRVVLWRTDDDPEGPQKFQRVRRRDFVAVIVEEQCCSVHSLPALASPEQKTGIHFSAGRASSPLHAVPCAIQSAARTESRALPTKSERA